MKKLASHVISLVIACIIAISFIGCVSFSTGASSTSTAQKGIGASTVATQSYSASSNVSSMGNGTVVESGEYSDKDSVALYIHTFGHLPSNYISKTKARNAGWVSTKGNLWEVLPGMSIGGSEYYNDDEQLPEASGRRWTECDIGYNGGFRGAERIVFSNDGLIYYTSDHYRTFERLY